MRRATAEVNVKEVHLTEEQGEKIEFEKVGAILKGQSVQMSQFLNVDSDCLCHYLCLLVF